MPCLTLPPTKRAAARTTAPAARQAASESGSHRLLRLLVAGAATSTSASASAIARSSGVSPRRIREPPLGDGVEPRDRRAPVTAKRRGGIREDLLRQVLRVVLVARAAADIAVDLGVVAPEGALARIGHALHFVSAGE